MRQAGLKRASLRPKCIVSKVEVERKFNLGPKFASIFLSEDWTKPQAQGRKIYIDKESFSFTVIRQPVEIIRDTYYDMQNGQLSQLGLWVRQRHVHVSPLDPSRQKSRQDLQAALECTLEPSTGDSKKSRWNAKLRIGGHFNDSQFTEFDGKKIVSDQVLRITERRTKLEDLQVFTDLQTQRFSWEVTQLADGTTPSAKMTIVVDEVTEAHASKGRSDKSAFTHTIGEVELFKEFVTEGNDRAEHEAERKKVADHRMWELKEFMLAHPDLFATTPKPIGKLTAYDTWKNTPS
ncbi:hypothetical protein E0Z10_g4922 [Xylaria hypoxylon]|uniref:CYTH domain-containing protein n=1 Tax=Xylaria hypoxylon TaxID=37992 RepID=A0A4Z0YHP4_9PEZI|nr:hypothetical protein E0Z10_g4922 [Xylaria hypoxylon]